MLKFAFEECDRFFSVMSIGSRFNLKETFFLNRYMLNCMRLYIYVKWKKKENRLTRNTLQRKFSIDINQSLVHYKDYWLLTQGNVAMFP